MDFRDTSIMTQVAFKGAIDLCRDIDVTTPEGQAEFQQAFSFLTDSLVEAIKTQQDPAERAAEVIKGNFPGTQVVQNSNANFTPPPAYVQPSQPGQFQLSIKGEQHGELPPWLYEAAAAKGVTEVYDNRDRAQGTKRPWFRSTTGGDNAPAFWPPRS
jgi:hypothetical protein